MVPKFLLQWLLHVRCTKYTSSNTRSVIIAVNSATYIELVMNCSAYWKISKISQDVHLYWGIFIDHSNMHFNLLNKCTKECIKTFGSLILGLIYLYKKL